MKVLDLEDIKPAEAAKPDKQIYGNKIQEVQPQAPSISICAPKPPHKGKGN